MQGAGLMARAGRKRKQGYRKPSGDLVNSDAVESAIITALRQPHRREAPLLHADDRRAETPLGILNMIGAVSNAEYAAARRYARIVNRYRQVINSPNHNPPSIAGAFEPKYGGGEITDPRERKAEYDAVLAVFDTLDRAGRTSADAVKRMAIYGEPCPLGCFVAMRRGLNMLRAYFELTDRGESVQGVGY